MRIVLALVAVALLALGVCLLSIGFIPSGDPVATSGTEFATKSQPTAGPAALGMALLAGGGLLVMMLLRRR